ncbi:LuxR C-terminal-related transcriptional regulator [Sorangium sp. So ce1151]
MLGEGFADKDIAERLGMPLSTVRTYVARVFQRLRVQDRRELIRRRL